MRRTAFAILVLGSFVVGWKAIVIADDDGAMALLCFSLSAVLAGWCVLDGRARGRPTLHVCAMLAFVAPPIGVPLHFLWSRGARGVLPLLGFAAVLAAAAAAGLLLKTSLVGWPQD